MRTIFGWVLLITSPGAFAQAVHYEQIIINPAGDANPRYFSEYNGSLYFMAKSEGSGLELWKSDGTQAGTAILKDIHPTGDALVDGNPYFLVQFNNKLYFKANDGVHGDELWVSDGTEAGTSLLKDINPGAASSSPYYFYVFNGHLYFSANDGVSGIELWISDGTESGTKMLKNIAPGTDVFKQHSKPDNFIEYKGKLYFFAANEENGRELWQSDGSEEGCMLVKDIWPGAAASISAFSSLIICGDKLFFDAETADGRELWTSDGTEQGTMMVKDINLSGSGDPREFCVYGEKLYFSAKGTEGREVWYTDGTEAGTKILKDINPGSGSFPGGFYVFNGQLFFYADDGEHGSELWVSEGSAEGTRMLKDINPGLANSAPKRFFRFGERLFFSAFSALTGGENLMVYSGTPESIMELRPEEANKPKPFNLGTEFFEFNDQLFYPASYTDKGQQIWKLTMPSGIQNNISDAGACRIQPNPSSGLYSLKLARPARLDIAIYTSAGQLAKQWTAEGDCIMVDLQAYPNGIYFIQGSNSQGLVLSTSLVKE